MKRSYTKIENPEEIEHRVKIVMDDLDTSPGTQSYNKQCADLLNILASTPSLSLTGEQHFERMVVFHDGAHWVVETTAKVSRKDD